MDDDFELWDLAEDMAKAYEVLRRLVIDDNGEDLLNAALCHADASEDELAALRRVEAARPADAPDGPVMLGHYLR